MIKRSINLSFRDSVTNMDRHVRHRTHTHTEREGQAEATIPEQS